MNKKIEWRKDLEVGRKRALLFSEKGIALVMVLVLSVIALAIMSGLLYMVISGTQISGIQKRYETALESGVGGADVTYRVIGARGDPGISNINFSITASSTCQSDKLNKSTANWDAACDTTLTIDPNTTTTYDMRFDLGINPTYRVYSKIVDTVEGNSGAETGLLKSGVVSSNTGEVTVMSVPYLYTIEIDAESSANSSERAKLSILYQY